LTIVITAARQRPTLDCEGHRANEFKEITMRRLACSSATRSSMIAALCMTIAHAGSAAEVSYTGTWECDATPALGIPMVRVPGTAVRDGNRLTVARIVHKPGTTEESGRAGGTTTIRDGRFVVETVGPEGRIAGRFEGTASDAEIVLKGIERLKFPDRGDGERTCRATLQRR
jgi:hypothetical protein